MARSVTTTSLGARALALRSGVAAVGDEIVRIPHHGSRSTHAFGPLVGVRCSATVTAVAYPLAVRMISCDSTDARVAIVVERAGPCHVVDLRRAEPMPIMIEFGPAVDVGRRVLGLPTPPETTPPVELLDTYWLHRVLDVVLDGDLGLERSWAPLSALHPLARSVIEPWCLRDRRMRLPLGWDAFRRRATMSGSPWPGLDPSVAAWLDDGSFARWCLADLPDRRLIIDDLRELLTPSVMACVDETLAWSARW